MMMTTTNKIVAMDIETESLTPEHIWVICAEDVNTGEREQFLNVTSIPEERDRFVEYCNNCSSFVFHNGIGFDVQVINKLLGNVMPMEKVIDTLIVSRLVDYTNDGHRHSLKAWGQRLGEFKTGFTDFSKLSEEMVEYCQQDVVVTVKLYHHFKNIIEAPEWQESLRCEHDIQILCEQMTDNGFYFDEDTAEELLGEIQTRMEDLEQSFQEDFPPKLTEINRIKYRRKADGSLFSSVTKAQEKYFATALDKSVDPPELVCYEYINFNPASPKQRIERLWEAGWKPFEKTKGHIEYERDQSKRF
jgi:DNA polymerase I-like protein with 3'-5' exonuclease and polymerase domains